MSVIRDLFAEHRSPKTAFVLGGGGNLGAVQVGMMKALFERGIAPDLVVGCSVGAINAAGLAGDPTLEGVEAMWRRWASLTSDDVFAGGRLQGPWQLIRKGQSLYADDGLRRLITEWVDFETFEEARIPFHVVAVSLRQEAEVWFSSGPILEPVLASAALPAIFPPVWIDGEAYIDGGVVNNVPVDRALRLGAERVYVLYPGNFERERAHPERPFEVLVQAFSIARSYRFKHESTNAPEDVEIVTLPGVDPGALRYNDMSRSAELMERAHRAATDHLSSLEAVAGQ